MGTIETAWTAIKPQLRSGAAKARGQVSALRAECRSLKDVLDLLGRELGAIVIALIVIQTERLLFHRVLDPAVIISLADWWAIAAAVVLVGAAPFAWLDERRRNRLQAPTQGAR